MQCIATQCRPMQNNGSHRGHRNMCQLPLLLSAKQYKGMQSTATQSNPKNHCKAQQSNAKQCTAKQSTAKHGKARQSTAKQGKAKQSNAKQSKARQNKSHLLGELGPTSRDCRLLVICDQKWGDRLLGEPGSPSHRAQLLYFV